MALAGASTRWKALVHAVRKRRQYWLEACSQDFPRNASEHERGGAPLRCVEEEEERDRDRERQRERQRETERDRERQRETERERERESEECKVAGQSSH